MTHLQMLGTLNVIASAIAVQLRAASHDDDPSNDKAVLVEARVTLQAALATLDAHLEKPEVPTLPELPPIDYTKYNVPDPRTLIIAILAPPEFRNGLPSNWSWAEWARVNDRVDPSIRPEVPGEAPDRSGTNLDAPGRREVTLQANHPVVFYRTVPPGCRVLELTAAPLEGDFFTAGLEALSGPGQSGEATPFEVSGGRARAKRIVSNPLPGAYRWTVTIDRTALCGVEAHLS